MDIVVTKRENFMHAYAALQRMVTLLESKPESEDVYWAFLTSVIKNFELCYEMCWKLLRHYLLTEYKVEANSPRAVFRLCGERGLCTNEIAEELMGLIDLRNATTHTYDPEIASVIGADIMRHMTLFKTVLECTAGKD